MLRPTVSRPVSLAIKHPSGEYDQIFIYCQTVASLFMWDALSDERMGLSFTIAAGPQRHRHSRVREVTVGSGILYLVLGNSDVMQQWSSGWNRCFLCGLCRGLQL
jgi:hypothetical protein